MSQKKDDVFELNFDDFNTGLLEKNLEEKGKCLYPGCQKKGIRSHSYSKNKLELIRETEFELKNLSEVLNEIKYLFQQNQEEKTKRVSTT